MSVNDFEHLDDGIDSRHSRTPSVSNQEIDTSIFCDVMAVDMPVIPLFELDAAIGFGVIGVKPCFVAGGKGLVLPGVVEIADTQQGPVGDAARVPDPARMDAIAGPSTDAISRLKGEPTVDTFRGPVGGWAEFPLLEFHRSMVGLADESLAIDGRQSGAGDRALTGFIPAAPEQDGAGFALPEAAPDLLPRQVAQNRLAFPGVQVLAVQVEA